MELLHEGSKVVHEAIVENAAQTNIKTRANNPKNGQGRSPKYVPFRLRTYFGRCDSKRARSNKGRAIDRKNAVAAASFHWQFMTISSGIKTVNGEAWALSPDHKSIVISPNDSNASSKTYLPKIESSLDAAVAVTQRANIPPPPSTALSLLLCILII